MSTDRQVLPSRGGPREFPWARVRVRRGPGPYSIWAATPGSIAGARAEVVQRARRAGASDAEITDIRLAVSEACTNAVLHAFPGPRVAETFIVSTASAGATFEVWVTDEGRGAAPTPAPDSLGMGLPLMAALSQALDIGIVIGGGTQVHMTFSLGASGGCPPASVAGAGDRSV